MRQIILVMILLFSVSGCANVVNQQAICDGTANVRTEHANALALDGGDKSVVTGAKLIASIDAACKGY
jgi:uncharacterized protein YceK